MSNATLPEQWEAVRLCDVTQKITDRDHFTPTYVEDGVIMVSPKDFDEDGRIDFTNCQFISKDAHERNRRKTDITAGDLVFTRIGARLGKACLITPDMPEFSLLHSAVMIRTASDRVLSEYLLFVLKGHELQSQIGREIQSIGVPDLGLDKINAFVITLPPIPQQRKIARILTTVDSLIEKTDALIAKYQASKQGMMHDLFTRGMDEHGHLRPPYEESPELYKQSELGWIPKEWSIKTLSAVAESAIDGPFGSNLKTEHYVSEAGVRVIRLQNIDIGHYDDSDRAFISDGHARLLSRHKVLSGDVIVAGMGEETHPVARACLYPATLPPAINKADCFRVRCKAEEMENPFLMLSLNAHYLRPWIGRFAQGVTRTRINVRNLKTLPLKVPPLAEQRTISRRIFAVAVAANELVAEKQKLYLQKNGLMQDLLSGKVRVKVDEAEEVATSV